MNDFDPNQFKVSDNTPTIQTAVQKKERSTAMWWWIALLGMGLSGLAKGFMRAQQNAERRNRPRVVLPIETPPRQLPS